MQLDVMRSHLRQILPKSIKVVVEGEGLEKTVILKGDIRTYYQKQLAQEKVKQYIQTHQNDDLAGSSITVVNELVVQEEVEEKVAD